MPRYYSLEEAANILNMPVEDLNEMAKKREVRAFADSGTWKFREEDIDQLAHDRASATHLAEDAAPALADDEQLVIPDDMDMTEIGAASDLADEDSGSDDELPFVGMDEDESEDFTSGFDDELLADNEPAADASADEDEDLFADNEPAADADADEDEDLFADDDDELQDAPSDSDVRLVADTDLKVPTQDLTSDEEQEDEDEEEVPLGEETTKAPSDSDIRLTFEGSGISSADVASPPEEDLGATTEISLDNDLPALDLDDDADLPPLEEEPALASEAESGSDELEFNFDDDLNTGFKVDDTDFELDLEDFNSESGEQPAQEAEDADDIQQTVVLDGQQEDEIGLAALDDEDQDVQLAESDDAVAPTPDDSGISLDQSDESGSDSEFELSLEDSDSESGSDIFETDDFDVPSFKEDDSEPTLAAEESGSEDTEEVSEESDFELAIDDDIEVEEEESGSEVVALDEDDEEEGDFEAEEDEEEEEDFADEEFDEYGDEIPATGAVAMPRGKGGAAVSENAPWGGMVLVPVMLTTMVLPLVGIMLYEVMRHAWASTTPYALNASLINWVADLAKSMGIGG